MNCIRFSLLVSSLSPPSFRPARNAVHPCHSSSFFGGSFTDLLGKKLDRDEVRVEVVGLVGGPGRCGKLGIGRGRMEEGEGCCLEDTRAFLQWNVHTETKIRDLLQFLSSS